jgi:hypothetical protein
MDNAVITALVQRRSVRAYKPEQITDDGLIGIGARALGYPAGPTRDPKPRKENYYRIVK